MTKRLKSRLESAQRGPAAAVAAKPAQADCNPQDAAAKQTAERLLRASPFHELHALEVVVEDHTVRLRGQVVSFFLKQIAQETIRSAARGGIVENDLEVHPGRRLH